MEPIEEENFEAMVQAALDSLPPQFAGAVENVAVIIEDEPTAATWASLSRSNPARVYRPGVELLGLYSGVDITRRSWDYAMREPDMITLFKGPLERQSRDEDDLREHVRRTVVHEFGHYFGLDDAELHAMGY